MEKYQVIMQMHEAMCFMDAVPDFVFEAPDERAAMKQAEQIIEHWETGKEISIGFNVNAKRLVSQMASNTFTSEVKNQILGWLSAIGTNLVCPLITAAAIIYCIFQLPQLFKAHRDGMSDVFWEFMWKEIIGLVVAVGTGVLWGLLAAGVFGTTV